MESLCPLFRQEMFFLTLKGPESIIFYVFSCLVWMDSRTEKLYSFPFPFCLPSLFSLYLSLLFIPFLHNTSFKFKGLLESPIDYSFTGGHFYVSFAKKKKFQVDTFNSGQRIKYSDLNFLNFQSLRVTSFLISCCSYSFCSISKD